VERSSSPSGVRGRAPAKNENHFGAFITQKPPLMNRILLSVAKCCVILRSCVFRSCVFNAARSIASKQQRGAMGLPPQAADRSIDIAASVMLRAEVRGSTPVGCI